MAVGRGVERQTEKGEWRVRRRARSESEPVEGGGSDDVPPGQSRGLSGVREYEVRRSTRAGGALSFDRGLVIGPEYRTLWATATGRGNTIGHQRWPFNLHKVVARIGGVSHIRGRGQSDRDCCHPA